MEAMSTGLPCAVLNLGGPNIIVDSNCGIKINVKDKDEGQISNEFVNSISELTKNPDIYEHKSKMSLNKIKQFNWTHKVSTIYNK